MEWKIIGPPVKRAWEKSPVGQLFPKGSDPTMVQQIFEWVEKTVALGSSPRSTDKNSVGFFAWHYA